jgi:hypothetical protein
VLAECLAGTDATASKAAAAQAGQWFARTDRTFDPQRARATALAQ